MIPRKVTSKLERDMHSTRLKTRFMKETFKENKVKLSPRSKNVRYIKLD